MTDWTIVLWSAARQIAEEAKLPPALWPGDDVAPQAFFQTLREDEDPIPALSYAAAALPKLEAIEWALHALPEPDENDPDHARRMLLRDAALRWVDEPDDENRRAMFGLTEGADSSWPETLVGLAIFLSGGSIAPDDLNPVTVEPSLCGVTISGAMQLAVANNIRTRPDLAKEALALADKVAVLGREAFSTK